MDGNDALKDRPGSASTERNDVYICYRNQTPDGDVARALNDLLVEIGFTTFFDKHDDCLNHAESPADLARCIERGLDRSQALIGIVSANSFTSPWVAYEIGSAMGRKRFKESGRTDPSPELRYPGESVCIAHLVCKNVPESPDFLCLSTLVPDMEQLGTWLQDLCEACHVDPRRSVAEALASDKKVLDPLRDFVDPKRFDEINRCTVRL